MIYDDNDDDDDDYEEIILDMDSANKRHYIVILYFSWTTTRMIYDHDHGMLIMMMTGVGVQFSTSIYNTGTEMIYTYIVFETLFTSHVYCHEDTNSCSQCMCNYNESVVHNGKLYKQTHVITKAKVKQNTWSFRSSFFSHFFPSSPRRAPLVSSLIYLVRCGYFHVSMCNGG